jgi:hypothetical protein
MDIQVFSTPNSYGKKRTSPRYIIVKSPKAQSKDKITKLQERSTKSHKKGNPSK